MAKTATTGFTEAFVHTDPFYRGTYKATLRRAASGSGVSDAVVTRTNLATNPSFETNTTGWGGYQATISRVAGTFGSGSYVGQAVATVTGVGGFFRSFTAVAGTTYTASLTGLRISGSRSYKLSFEFYNGATYLGGFNPTSDTFATATRISWTFTAPAGTTVAYIVCYSAGTGSIGDTFQIDNVLIEASSSLLPYFDGAYVDAYNGYTLTSKSWSGTADASTSTATFRPTVAHKVTQLRLDGLTDFSFPYRFGGRFYLGFARIQKTATGTGQGAESALRLISRFRTATGSGLGTQTAARLIKRFRTATGSGTGTETASRLVSRYRSATGSGQGTETSNRLISRYRTATGSGVGSELAVSTPTARRTATGAGLGTENSVRVVIKYSTATGVGTGTSANTIRNGFLRTGYGLGGATAGDTATPKLTAFRAATGAGTGSQSASRKVISLRYSINAGVGSSTVLQLRTVQRTGTSVGIGESLSTIKVTSKRLATGSGVGSQSAIGARVSRRIGSGEGLGASDTLWDKSHIFRVPITEGYPFAVRLSDESPDRLFAHTPQGTRAKNLYRLDDGSYTTTDPRRPERITRTYFGGHDNFLTQEEITELTAAGYGSSIT